MTATYSTTAALDYWHVRLADTARRINPGADDWEAEPLPLPEWAVPAVLAAIEWRTGRLAALATLERIDGLTLPAERITTEIDAAALDLEHALALSSDHGTRDRDTVRHSVHAQHFGATCPGCDWGKA